MLSRVRMMVVQGFGGVEERVLLHLLRDAGYGQRLPGPHISASDGCCSHNLTRMKHCTSRTPLANLAHR